VSQWNISTSRYSLRLYIDVNTLVNTPRLIISHFHPFSQSRGRKREKSALRAKKGISEKRVYGYVLLFILIQFCALSGDLSRLCIRICTRIITLLREGCITSRYAPSVTDAERLRDSYNIIAYLRYYIPAARCDTSCCDRGHPLPLYPSPNYRMMTFPRRGALRDKANSRRAGSTRSSLRNSWRSVNDVGATWAAVVIAAKSPSTEAEVSRHLTRIGRLLAAFHRRDEYRIVPDR